MNDTIEIKVDGGILKASVIKDDPECPGIRTVYIPDATNFKRYSYPSVLVEKPVDEDLRALTWEHPDDGDYTSKIVFEDKPFEPKPSPFSDPENFMDELMAKIAEKARKNREEEETKKMTVTAKIEAAIQNIKERKNDIQEIMQLANKCIEEGLKIPQKYFSDSFDNKVGFMGHNTGEKIQYVGFYNGGECGPYDFYTDGEKVFRHNREDNTSYDLDNPKDAEKFVDEFGSFKMDFFMWLLDEVVEED